MSCIFLHISDLILHTLFFVLNLCLHSSVLYHVLFWYCLDCVVWVSCVLCVFLCLMERSYYMILECLVCLLYCSFWLHAVSHSSLISSRSTISKSIFPSWSPTHTARHGQTSCGGGVYPGPDNSCGITGNSTACECHPASIQMVLLAFTSTRDNDQWSEEV